MGIVNHGSIQMQTEISVICRQPNFRLFNDEFFSNPAVSDQIFDRANLEAKLLFKSEELRQARHGAIVIDNFRQHAGRVEIRQSG